MDRDASSLVPPASPDDVVPPVALASVRATGLSGLGLIGGAALLGLLSSAMGETPTALNTARLFLVLIGSITVGAAISMRPDIWWAWLMGSGAALLGTGGLPAHWDSFRLVYWVMFSVSLAGALIVSLPVVWRFGAASAIVLFHFTGIFLATTSPPTDPLPAPWVTVQLFSRIFNPYLQFIYQRNAYHFYSPNPGPASVLAFLIKTDTGETELVTDPVTKETVQQKVYRTEWVVFPKRPADVRDPLGLSYYRRLSITEQVARGSPGIMVPDQFEKTEMGDRRSRMSPVIPYHPLDPLGFQYKLPSPDVSRYLLPSYASHMILQNTPDKEAAAKTTIKVYRLEHRTLSIEQFAGKQENGRSQSPYHPGTYRAFFLGEFDARGELINPQEPLLYWLLPIIPRTVTPNNPNDPFHKEYLDYLSVHALGMSIQDVLKADESKGKVFNWSQLR